VPYIFRGGGEAKIEAADFGQRPLSCTRDAQPMNSQPGKTERLAGSRENRRSYPSCMRLPFTFEAVFPSACTGGLRDLSHRGLLGRCRLGFDPKE
jgi:hypothetical protein